jgi:hypothetical protein
MKMAVQGRAGHRALHLCCRDSEEGVWLKDFFASKIIISIACSREVAEVVLE